MRTTANKMYCAIAGSSVKLVVSVFNQRPVTWDPPSRNASVGLSSFGVVGHGN
jgi:hypothetical protein